MGKPAHDRGAVEQSMNGHKQAIILSGGGAYGAYEVGVIKALFTGKSPATNRAPLDPDIFTGTSIGAVNAVLLLSHPEMDSARQADCLQRIWLNEVAYNSQNCGNGFYRLRGNPFPYLDPECFIANPLKPLVDFAADTAAFTRYWIERGTNFLLSPDNLDQRAIELINIGVLFSSSPYEQMVRKNVSFDALRRSEKVLRIVATNWTTGELRVFGNADMTEELGDRALRASFALPAIFPPVVIDDELYVDGSVGMNTPVLPAIEAGADTIYIIFVDPLVKNIPVEPLPDTTDTIYRLQIIQWAIKAKEDIETVRWINRGLEVMEQAAGGQILSDTGLRDLIRAGGQLRRRINEGLPYKKITIHIFRPRRGAAEALRALNLDRQRVSALIELGYNDTLDHDCAANDCVMPG
jgi:predicted acylesterase/phospholipase RssA